MEYLDPLNQLEVDEVCMIGQMIRNQLSRDPKARLPVRKPQWQLCRRWEHNYGNPGELTSYLEVSDRQSILLH
jgi:hypothetical protein